MNLKNGLKNVPGRQGCKVMAFSGTGIIIIDHAATVHYACLVMKRIRKGIKRGVKRISYPFTAGIIMLAGRLIRKISRERAEKTAFIIGDLVYGVLRIRRGLVEKNLSHAFPEKNLQEIREIARQSYRNQVLNFVEMLRIPLIRCKQDAEKIVEIKADESMLERIVHQKGALMVSAHLGSWEIIGVCTGMLLAPVNLIVKPVKNMRLDIYLNKLRTMHGNKVIPKNKALRQGLKVLNQGELLGVLGDQSNKDGDFYVDFLGRKATIFLGPAFWSLKAGVPLFVETCKRLGKGRYLIEISEISTHDLSYNREDITTLAQRYTMALEDFIRKNPEEWLWLHDRWKRTPDLPN